MLEYFTYKKYKKHQAQKQDRERQDKERQEQERQKPNQETSTGAAATAALSSRPDPPRVSEPIPSPTPGINERPLLNDEDERFLEQLTAIDPSVVGGDDDDEGPKPPLPPRIRTPEIKWDSDDESRLGIKNNEKDKGKGKGKGKGAAKDSGEGPSRLGSAAGGIGRRISLMVRRNPSKKPDVRPAKLAVPGAEAEADREKDDLTHVLDDLNLSAQNNRVFSLSAESQELATKFTQVLKDLVNGVPTAAGDLKNLLEDPQGILARNFEKLPSSLQKLVTQMPTKITSSLAPELLAVAAESQGIKHNKEAGVKESAMKLLMPHSLQELITKPGAIVSMLKAIMNALKLRWPAFIGTNVLWSVALFLLMFVLWYCHKRGREVRLEKEGQPVEAGDRIEELPDDPQLPAPHPVPVSAEATGSAPDSSASAPPPPKGSKKAHKGGSK